MLKKLLQVAALILVFCVPFTRYQQVQHKWTRADLTKFKNTVGIVTVNYVGGAIAEGASVVIRKDGTALTAAHLFTHGQPDSVWMIVKNGNWYEMSLLEIDRQADIAVIRPKAASPTFAFAPLKNAPSVQDNTPIVVIGHPLYRYWWVETGIVLRTVYSPYYFGDIVHIAALVQPGNSGGPILDAQGRVVGIISAFHMSFDGGYDYGIAVSLVEIHKLLARSDAKEPYRRPQIRRYSLKEVREVR